MDKIDLPYICEDHPDAKIRHEWNHNQYVWDGDILEIMAMIQIINIFVMNVDENYHHQKKNKKLAINNKK